MSERGLKVFIVLAALAAAAMLILALLVWPLGAGDEGTTLTSLARTSATLAGFGLAVAAVAVHASSRLRG